MDEIMTKIKPLSLLVAIVDMNQGEKVSMFLNEHGYRFHFVSIAEGTAPTEIRSYWGFGETEKSIVWGLIPKDNSKYIFSILNEEFHLTKPNTGIAFIVPIKSFADPIIASHIASCGDKPNDNNTEDGGKKMEDRVYSLLMAIVKKGFSDEVMEAARAVGARGGTIMKARGTGEHEIVKFLGITIEPEKDIILILTKQENRSAIMKTIYEKAGLHTEGNGLIIALPVDEVLGSFNLNNDIASEAQKNSK
jgi:nitrogen regulatory protein PII